MLYTTIPIPKLQVASDSFRTRKIGDEAPAPVFESRISIMSAQTSMKMILFLQYVWAFAASHLLQQTIPITHFCDAISTTKNISTFIPIPSLIVSFREFNDKVNDLLSEIGFSRQSSGRYKYAKGPATDANIARLLAEQASADAYSLMGSCNIKGYLCFSIINRLLHAALGFMTIEEKDMPAMWELADIDGTAAPGYVVKNSSQLPSNGILFPYFDGMCLPDKANVPRIFLDIFSKCLGKTAPVLTTSARMIQEGWPSLSTTSSGLVISHIVFGLSLAMSGAQMRIVLIGGVYNGFILSGTKFTLFKGGVEHKLLSREALVTEFEKLDEHDQTILDIAEILSGAQYFEDSKKFEVVLPEHIQTPRRLHYAIRLRKFTTEDQATVSKKILKLHFAQTYWDRSNDGRVATVIRTLLNGEWLPSEAPYCLTSGSVFSRDPILSALAVFGDKSISLCGFGNNTTITLNKSKKFFESTDKGLKLDGIPIFFKNLADCFSDWETVIKTGIVTMKTGAKDKKGTTKVAGIGTWVTFSSPSYEQVCADLSVHIAAKIGKRKERGSLEEGDGLGHEPSASKIRKTVGENNIILGMLGKSITAPEATPGEEQMQVDPFA